VQFGDQLVEFIHDRLHLRLRGRIGHRQRQLRHGLAGICPSGIVQQADQIIERKWARPGKNGCGEELNPLDRVELIILLTEDLSPLHWLCARFDGYFVPNPQPGTAPKALLAAENGMFRRWGEFETFVSAAAEKGRITNPEAKEIRSRWERVKSAAEGFVHGCEQGAFRLVALCLMLGGSFTVEAAPVLAVA
jgi:hypothetical protein